ncbi:MAG: 5-oxoprolinase subunit PxpA [Eubacterium sp.]|nr:5-oxoprolinase subunit PxpA [Eubacterium sp.]
MRIDLNCDLGESFGNFTMGNDNEMMKYITSANIACGFHAGDANVMCQTVNMAKNAGVAIGAHPGFPDLEGFGRRNMTCTNNEIKNYIRYQVGALREFCNFAGVELQHVKPHGNLYVMAMEDDEMARAILEVIASLGKNVITFALNDSAISNMAKSMGVPVAIEGYGDREHTNNGHIVQIRKGPDEDRVERLTKRAIRLVKEGKVITNTGDDIDLRVQTLCVHGDTYGAWDLMKNIREKLEKENIEITAISNFL